MQTYMFSINISLHELKWRDKAHDVVTAADSKSHLVNRYMSIQLSWDAMRAYTVTGQIAIRI
jgi:hypothetical protein